MNIPCCTKPSLCQDPASPVTNFSSEDPDVPRVFCTYYGQGFFPPLGVNWQQSNCSVTGEGVDSGDTTADQCVETSGAFQDSQRQAINCRRDNWTPPDDGTDIPLTVFFNSAQSCEFECPDGNIFTYTIPAGTFSDFSQIRANTIAHSVACNAAAGFHVCIGALTPEFGCVGQEYNGTCLISGPAKQWSATIISGTLPPGLLMSQPEEDNSIDFDGFPTTSGQTTITVQANDTHGNFMQKQITFKILEVLPATISNPVLGSAYSQTFTAPSFAPSPLTWSVASGTLPAGLSLNASTGALTGTPTTPGDSTFAIKMTGPNSVTCQRTYTVSVVAPTPSLYYGFDQDSLFDEIHAEELVVFASPVPAAQFVAGKFGRAVRLPPSGLFINSSWGLTTADTTFLGRTSGDVCLAAWQKVDALPTGASLFLDLFLFDQRDGGGSTLSTVQLSFRAGSSNLRVVAGDYLGEVSGAAYVGTGWHFYEVHISAAGQVRLLVDNVTLINDNGVILGVPPIVASPDGRVRFINRSSVAQDGVGDFTTDEWFIFLNQTISDGALDFLWNGGAGRTWPW